jgi:hypothetical protein
MARIAYIDKKFKASSLSIIQTANEIIDEYAAQGYALTLRQLYYRFVAGDLIPNKQSEYKRLGSIINDGRLAGMIDWDAIEDRGRNLNKEPHWKNPSHVINSAAQWYNVDKWEGQEHRVEVWVEKQALEAVVERAASSLDCPCFACKGYMSQSEMWRAAQRFESYGAQTPVIIHLGDHDPSGIDMTRDIRERLEMFGMPMEVNRIALNMDQVEAYNPPPNPAKLTDSRVGGYMVQFGSDSWELDALEPAVLEDLITKTIQSYCEQDKYDEHVEREEEETALLQSAAREWDTIAETLEG